MKTAKRYVLFESDSDLSEEEFQELGRVITKRHGEMPIIGLAASRRAMIVRTTAEVAARMREPEATIDIRGKTVKTVLVSGAIGKLKKRAEKEGRDRLAKFLSDEFFTEFQSALSQDQKWGESTKAVKTSIAFGVTDTGQNYVLSVENGTTLLQKVAPGTSAEFSFEGTYETWTKVVKGEVDLQSAVLKGLLKFRGSITKILMYRDRFMRVAEIMRSVPKEF
ncbi:MAG: SCP2 sterol-binding domain-containing protein [Thaumarchaeota archaeon]|nr:SCP2 sterol-binding domain-containing protein [Nitrososphaerota archaeon]